VFDLDPRKAIANYRKHKISFDEAAEVWADPLARIEEDLLHDGRFRMMGHSRTHPRLLLVVFAEIRDGLTRIISARRPTASERRQYAEGTFGDRRATPPRRRYGPPVRNPYWRLVRRYGIRVRVKPPASGATRSATATNPYAGRIARYGYIVRMLRAV
jgi:hypothetical protein